MPADPRVTRREMVRTASGLVLAASSLLLPHSAEIVDAREGSGNGRLGGRHGKNRRGRDQDKRRDHRERQGNEKAGPPPGRGLFEFRRTAVTVKSFVDPLLTFTLFYRVKTGLDTYGPWIEDHAETPAFGRSTRFANDRFRIGLLVSAPDGAGEGEMFLDLRNVTYDFPKASATYRYEGGLDPVHNDLGPPLMREKAFSEMSTPDFGFFVVSESLILNHDIRRLADSEDYIEFQLILSTRSQS